MPQYFLARHAYLCVTEDHPVLLDLRHDAYLALGRRESASLTHFIQGWPDVKALTADGSQCTPPDSENHLTLLHALMERKLVTEDDCIGKPATPVQIARPELTLSTSSTRDDLFSTGNQRVRLTALDWGRFFRSYFHARLSLGRRKLEVAIERARSRKCGASNTACRSLEDISKLVDKFDTMRRFTYTKRGKCLLDSFVLTEFLSHYEVFPSWVFGVATGPFGAHSWVQYRDVVLNDIPERVRRFTPILEV